MEPFPHTYEVTAAGTASGDVTLESERLPDLTSAAPAQFGGPGTRWSPETLLVGAVADCFVLTFRAVAGMSQFPWISMRCEATGTVDRVDRVARVTAITLRVQLEVAEGGDEAKARRLLEKAEQSCLISQSLKAPVHLQMEVKAERTAA